MTTDFQPIEEGTYSWTLPDGLTRLSHHDEDKIAGLLMGHKVVKVNDTHLVMDDGTVLKFLGHEGGCACSAGDYDLTALNGVDNIITRVEFYSDPAGDDDSAEDRQRRKDAGLDEWTGTYRIYVYADNQQINLMEVEGSDGNGYYGTGYEILVRKATA